MIIKLFISVLFVVYCMLISGCRSTSVRNVDESQFVVPAYANMDDIKNAIGRGSVKAGWRTKSIEPGVLMASYSYKRNRFGAVVKINYDHDSYQINYHSSHNLKYKENIASESDSPEFVRDSKDFFFENNPFKKDADSTVATTKPATIHKIYNKWVSNLETKINAELAVLSQKKKQLKPLPRKRAVKVVDSCDDRPVFNVSGLGKISRSSVNIRKGAGTQCAILSVRQHDRFTLLGQKNNWYYIALSSGENGWIYAPLVSQVTNKKQSVEKQLSSIPPPPVATPVMTPAKTISIAVIRFKTLNKEAQDISLGELISETFTSSLVNSRNFKIIEREQLDKLVKEMEMGQTGFIETTDAVEIGKMLHADAIITGSVALLGGQIQLNARIIEVESAYVISADTKTMSYTLKNINRMTNEIVSKLASKLDGR